MTIPNDNPFALNSKGRSLGRPVGRSLALIGICCLAVYGLHVGSRAWLIDRLSFGLAEHPPHIQAERMAMLAEFGGAGLPIIVESLASENDELSKNAYQTLLDMQGRWQAGAISGGPSLNLKLVQEIREIAQDCPWKRRPLLANLLNQTILDTVESNVEKDQQSYELAGRLLAVLGDNTGSGAPRLLARLGDSTEGSSLGAASGYGSGSLLPPLPTRLLNNVDDNFDGKLGDTNLSEANRGGDPDPSLSTAWIGVEPGQGSVSSGQSPLGNGNTRNYAIRSSSEATESNPLVRDLRGDGGRIDPIVENPLTTYDTRSVIDFLASPQPALVQSALQELRDRQLIEAEIDLAARLVAPDPAIRLAMVRELPSRTDVDPRTWLLWLAADDERDVRLEAISMLGTMDDPSIKDALRGRLGQERDVIVAFRLRKVLGLR
jgi:hypothetical protein